MVSVIGTAEKVPRAARTSKQSSSSRPSRTVDRTPQLYKRLLLGYHEGSSVAAVAVVKLHVAREVGVVKA